MSFIRSILGRGLKNPSSQGDAEKKKSINSKSGAQTALDGNQNAVQGPQPLLNQDANAQEEHVFR